MIGGLVKSVSRLALVAAAVTVGGVAAQAADLGGNCCADLEERVAELEATTARKGNRKVSLEVSGHVNEMMVYWSGDQFNSTDSSGFAVATNNSSRSRFRFKGDAKITADWSAGFLIEIGVRGTNNSQSASFNATNLNVKSGLDVRHEALYLASKSFGEIWLGHTSSSTDGITEICLGCTSGQGPDTGPYLGGFRPNGAGGRSWQHLAVSDGGRTFAGEGDRRDMVKYTTPSIGGFLLSGAVGSDQFYDVAARYAGEFGGIRIAAGVGYQVSREQITSSTKGFAGGCTTGANTRVDCTALGASASIMHVPTGLYIAGAYGKNEDKLQNTDDRGYYVTAGINKKFSSLGATNVYGEYGKSDRGIGATGGTAAAGTLWVAGDTSNMKYYGVGINQTIDAAAMDIYLQYKHFDGSINAGDVANMDMVVLGAIIKF